VGLPLQRPDYRTEAARGRHDLRTRRLALELGKGQQHALSVRRPIELVVLNCWVTETNDTPCASKSSTSRLHAGECRWRPPGSLRRRCGGRSRLGACRPPPSRGQALEPVNRLAVALAVGVVHGGEQVGRLRQLELHDGQCEAGMTLEDAREDQVAHRQRRIERLRRATAGVAQRFVAGRRGSCPAVASPCAGSVRHSITRARPC